mmetsp:Transcript_32540/g.60141  ORF Transcript_32540/g.60141 Transcript_32540/m.60141 type:complete len:99 (+) Transcript_32540:118-414(+)
MHINALPPYLSYSGGWERRTKSKVAPSSKSFGPYRNEFVISSRYRNVVFSSRFLSSCSCTEFVFLSNVKYYKSPKSISAFSSRIYSSFCGEFVSSSHR